MTQPVAQQVRRTALKLAFAGLGMFAFAFALVPLYGLLCDALGINGATNKTAYEYVAASQVIDKNRLIKIEFIANNHENMPWDFSPEKFSIRVHPGELHKAIFFAQNGTDRAMIGQAVPNVTPAQAAQYFQKTECFCFEQQKLEAGESLDMPLRFVVDPDLPASVHTISLSYTLFDVTDPLTVNKRGEGSDNSI